jgi:periplasmic protein TonB
MTQTPVLQNRADIQRALEAAYPPVLRNAGIGGTPTVWFFVDENGAVQRTLLNQGSGHAELDAAALQVASMMRFAPALNREQRVPVWISIPIVFRAR